MFSEIGVLKNFVKFTGHHLCQSLFLDQVAEACNLIKKLMEGGLFIDHPLYLETAEHFVRGKHLDCHSISTMLDLSLSCCFSEA